MSDGSDDDELTDVDDVELDKDVRRRPIDELERCRRGDQRARGARPRSATSSRTSRCACRPTSRTIASGWRRSPSPPSTAPPAGSPRPCCRCSTPPKRPTCSIPTRSDRCSTRCSPSSASTASSRSTSRPAVRPEPRRGRRPRAGRRRRRRRRGAAQRLPLERPHAASGDGAHPRLRGLSEAQGPRRR